MYTTVRGLRRPAAAPWALGCDDGRAVHAVGMAPLYHIDLMTKSGAGASKNLTALLKNTCNSLWKQGAVVSLETPPGPGQLGQNRNFYQNLFWYWKQMGEFVVRNGTRPTDRHKIDFLKIYISHFFKAKTGPGTP